ncbi:MAG: hypothetical protein ABH951_00485 [Patescibacteria group bacterium]
MIPRPKEGKGLISKFENRLCVPKWNAVVRIFFFFFFLVCITAPIAFIFVTFPYAKTKTDKISLAPANYIALEKLPDEKVELTMEQFLKFPYDTVFLFADGFIFFLVKEHDTFFFHCFTWG